MNLPPLKLIFVVAPFKLWNQLTCALQPLSMLIVTLCPSFVTVPRNTPSDVDDPTFSAMVRFASPVKTSGTLNVVEVMV